MYKSKLTMKDTQKAIKIVKDTFELKLAESLNLDRVSAPIMVFSSEKINDDLGIINSALKFNIERLNREVEIVQSLAKWKRMALLKYGYNKGEGIYTDMNAIRPLDETDMTHSLYVDQWDWELVISEKDRKTQFLESVVIKIVEAIKCAKRLVNNKFKVLNETFDEEVFFIDSHDLYLMYPNMTSEKREHEITKTKKIVFIKKIGNEFTKGIKHDTRAADYDDWDLNGDLLFWSENTNSAIELSSMGIRVDKKALLKQLEISNRQDLKDNVYHKGIIDGLLPLTIGGGIGQSRLCMVLLEKKHIAEVQASIWSRNDYQYFKDNKIMFL